MMLLFATEVWRVHGGVQRYMRTICRILGDRSFRVDVLTLLDREADHLREEPGCKAECCGGSKWTFSLKAVHLALKGRAHVAIVGHVHLLPLVWVLFKLRLIRRYAVVLHGIESWRRLHWSARMGARDATAIVATTQYTAREFCYYNGLPNLKCTIIPLACTLPPCAARQALPESELRVLCVARLAFVDAGKGVDTLLRAISLDKESGLSLTLDLVGEGDDRARLELLAVSLGIEKSVRFHGSVPDWKLERLLSESHVFAMPSKKEGFGIVFLEAMVAGLPCIGANHGGTPEVIQHGENGFLIEYGDANQLLFFFHVLADAPAVYEAMSSSARRRVAGALSYSLMDASWCRLLDVMNDHVPAKAR